MNSGRLIVIWVVCSFLLALSLLFASRAILLSELEKPLTAHLEIALDEAHFSSAENRVNDHGALLSLGKEINQSLVGFIEQRWYAPRTHCTVSLVSIDDVVLSEEIPENTRSLLLRRNDIPRDVQLHLSCEINWPVILAACVLLGVIFVALARSLPKPLTARHSHWINTLLAQAYSREEAFKALRSYADADLNLNTTQQACLEHLHDPSSKNISEVLAIVTDPRIARLPLSAVPWLLYGLRTWPGDIDAALELSQRPDTVQIDLPAHCLRIRELSIPMSRTPLFYYAWYCLKRLEGDGWVTNPPSNRPDMAVGQELVALMSSYEGHARAIRDLQQSGLKARTLDQNRSKIKDEIAAVIGEELAAPYLFESSRSADELHTRYRIGLEATAIDLIT